MTPLRTATNTTEEFQELIDAACATHNARMIKRLHARIEALDLLGEVDGDALRRAVRQLTKHIQKLNPISDASFELQSIRDTITPL